MPRKRIAVLTGAGISAESGLKTFRDAGGLWEGYRIEDVATPSAWHKDRKLVLDFYNMRRKGVLEAEPNEGHKALVSLEAKYHVDIITQNVDDLHEKAGSSNILHLHGEIMKARSTANPELIYDIDGWELKEGDKCVLGSQLRPHIVWFGEAVPMMEDAIQLVSRADIFIVVGTSLEVYPAASLIDFVMPDVPVYLIDPGQPSLRSNHEISIIRKKASEGVPELAEQLLKDDQNSLRL